MAGIGIAFRAAIYNLCTFSFHNESHSKIRRLAEFNKSCSWIYYACLQSMKFLMTIDSVYSISRDLFLAIWIVLFSLLGFYQQDPISMPVKLPHIGTFRLFFIIAVFICCLPYGLFGAPLKSLSSFCHHRQPQHESPGTYFS